VSVVEVSTFRLPPGTDVPAFLALDKRVQNELVPNQPGFMRRTTAHHDDDWLVVTLWASEEAAAAFAEASAGDPVRAAFEGSLAPGSLTTKRYATLG
jgi:heme-degrading monooxygenase HmoA